MADVIHRTTLEFLRSRNEPEYPEPVWKHNPDMTAVAGVPPKYWKAPADWAPAGAGPVEMTQPEKDAVDAAADAALVAQNRALAAAEPDETVQYIGWRTRGLIELLNQRDNFLTTRVAELQSAMDAMKASTGAVQNMRDAIPAAWLATNTRPRGAAIQDYKDEIAAGGADS
jgi:hypothetical protein